MRPGHSVCFVFLTNCSECLMHQQIQLQNNGVGDNKVNGHNVYGWDLWWLFYDTWSCLTLQDVITITWTRNRRPGGKLVQNLRFQFKIKLPAKCFLSVWALRMYLQGRKSRYAKLSDSYPERLSAIIKSKEASTKYLFREVQAYATRLLYTFMTNWKIFIIVFTLIKIILF